MGKATKESLSDLHGVIAEQLTERLKSGLWAASDVAAAIKFLKDNDITADPGENKALADMKAELVARAKARGEQTAADRQGYKNVDELRSIATEELNRTFDPTNDWMN